MPPRASAPAPPPARPARPVAGPTHPSLPPSRPRVPPPPRARAAARPGQAAALRDQPVGGGGRLPRRRRARPDPALARAQGAGLHPLQPHLLRAGAPPPASRGRVGEAGRRAPGGDAALGAPAAAAAPLRCACAARRGTSLTVRRPSLPPPQSLLLVFRTNASYGRFDEARKLWGNIVNRRWVPGGTTAAWQTRGVGGGRCWARPARARPVERAPVARGRQTLPAPPPDARRSPHRPASHARRAPPR